LWIIIIIIIWDVIGIERYILGILTKWTDTGHFNDGLSLREENNNFLCVNN